MPRLFLTIKKVYILNTSVKNSYKNETDNADNEAEEEQC